METPILVFEDSIWSTPSPFAGIPANLDQKENDRDQSNST